jgi:acetolactate synthase-1/2/3 large subunit
VNAQRERVRIKTSEISPSAIVDAVQSATGDVRVTVDAGAHMFPVTMLWPAAQPNDFLISNGLSTMGFALPAAIGAALIDRDRPVVAFTGDAGLLMCAAELQTARRERLKVITVVFDDERLSLIDVKQRQRGYPEAGVAMGRVDWEAVGRAFGVAACAVADERSLASAVQHALTVDGPVLIAAKTDASAYAAMLKFIRG